MAPNSFVLRIAGASTIADREQMKSIACILIATCIFLTGCREPDEHDQSETSVFPVVAVMAAPFALTALESVAAGALVLATGVTIAGIPIAVSAVAESKDPFAAEAKRELNWVNQQMKAPMTIQLPTNNPSKPTKMKLEYSAETVVTNMALTRNEKTEYINHFLRVSRLTRGKKFRDGGCVEAMTQGSSPNITHKGSQAFRHSGVSRRALQLLHLQC